MTKKIRRRATTTIAALRSQAAFKAWETRRTQIKAEKRSEAARKAWRTRRANSA